MVLDVVSLSKRFNHMVKYKNQCTHDRTGKTDRREDI